MAHEYSVDPTRRLVSVRFWGVLTPDEILATADELTGDARLSEEFSELIDLRELTSVDAVTAQDVRAIAASRLDPSSRRAFVTSDSLTFGLARMFAALRGLKHASEPIGVFRTLNEAEEWLGLTAS